MIEITDHGDDLHMLEIRSSSEAFSADAEQR